MLWQYLKTDVIGAKKTLYGTAGDRVVVIANHHPALIVQNEKGDKFSTTFDNLSDKPIKTIINETRSIPVSTGGTNKKRRK